MQTKGVFNGVKVLDFTWVVAGALATKYLADFGATVVKVESVPRPDIMRRISPYKDNIESVDRSGGFIFYNANKYGISVNLNHPKGVHVIRRLVSWCDVVVENFTPGTMEKWGLGYEELKKIKPDIIMVRSSMEGHSGPRAGLRLTGSQGVGLAGFTYLTGFPDRDPVHPYGAYTDFIGPRLTVAALVAALDHRERTGQGQCLELSQYEMALHFLAPAILDYTVNKREAERMGNACSRAAPHSVYRCRGDDRWCAIAVFTDEQWSALCDALGRPQWTNDPRFTTLLGRKAHEEILNPLVEEWTLQFTAEEVTRRLQAAGVPAAEVQNTADIYDDPEVWEQGQLWLLEHGEIGPVPHLGQSIRLSQTPARPVLPSPCLGQHTEYVMTQILGMSTEEFVELLNDGTFD